MGMLGMHGTYWANMAMHYSDLVVAIGARFDDRVTGKVSEFCPHAKVIHIDIDPTSIRKNVNVDIPIVGDCKMVLRELIQILRATVNGDQRELRKPWWNQIREWQQAHPLAYQQEADGPIKPQHVIKRLYDLTKDRDPIVSTDVGQHQMWAAQYFKLAEAESLADLRGAWVQWGSDFRPPWVRRRLSRPVGALHCRRRQRADEYAGNGDSGGVINCR